MSDVLERLDARGHAAGSAVRTRAAMRAPSVGNRHVSPRAWVRPVLVLGVVAALIAGLLALTHRPAPPADHRGPDGLRYVIDGSAGGITVRSATDAGVQTIDATYDPYMVVYGTAGDPTAPTIVLLWEDPATLPAEQEPVEGRNTWVYNATGVRQFSIDGGVAACGLLKGIEVVMCSRETANGPVDVRVVGFTVEEMEAVLAAVEVVEGGPRLAVDALRPGMQLLTADLASRTSGAAGGYDPGVSTSEYTTERGRVVLHVGWEDEQEMAVAAANGEWREVELVGSRAYRSSSPYSEGLLWTKDGRLFALIADAGTDVLALAAHVRPAGDDEWLAATAATNASTGESPETTGTAPEDSVFSPPQPTLAPDAVIVDVDVVQDVTNATPDQGTFSVQLPDGSFGSLVVTIVGDQLSLMKGSGGSGMSIPDRTTNLGTMTDDWSDVFVISTDPSATQLRVVRSNGERYTLDLVALTGHPDVRIGALLAPQGELVGAEVLDTDGDVLQTSGAVIP